MSFLIQIAPGLSPSDYFSYYNSLLITPLFFPLSPLVPPQLFSSTVFQYFLTFILLLFQLLFFTPLFYL